MSIHGQITAMRPGSIALQEARDEALKQRRMRRALVDMIAESRSRAVRVALFGTLVQRPDPEGRNAPSEREHNVKVLTDTVGWLERSHAILARGVDPMEEYDEALCDWLRGFVKAERDVVPALEAMAKASRLVAQTAEAGGAALGRALGAHYELRRGSFMATVTRFCDAIWREIDDRHDAELAAAAGAVDATQKTLQRIETISMHVRLVAINAAIEANQLGDKGRGIGFIATEFKTLAEELHTLSSGARRDLEVLLPQG